MPEVRDLEDQINDLAKRNLDLIAENKRLNELLESMVPKTPIGSGPCLQCEIGHCERHNNSPAS